MRFHNLSGLLDLSLGLAAATWFLAYLIQAFISCWSSTFIGASLGPGAGESSGPSENAGPGMVHLAGLSQWIGSGASSGVGCQFVGT